MRSSRQAQSAGQIILAATPIGNPHDASARLRELIETADLVAAEDTRRLLKLANALSVTPRGKIVSYHEHNEAQKTQELLAAAQNGATVLMVSDAGMPAVSDPGFRLAQAAREAEVRITTAPGASAVLTALALSGLPTDRFVFEGFLPRKAGERSRHLKQMAAEPRTMVFFEAPHRLGAMLAALAAEFGDDRPAAVARELTKTYEELLSGTLSELAAWASEGNARGEIVVVVGGKTGVSHQPEELVEPVLERAAAGERLKDAVAQVAQAYGVSKRELYQAALQAKK